MAQLCLTGNSFALWMRSCGARILKKCELRLGWEEGPEPSQLGGGCAARSSVPVCADVHLSVQSRVVEGLQGSWEDV